MSAAALCALYKLVGWSALLAAALVLWHAAAPDAPPAWRGCGPYFVTGYVDRGRTATGAWAGPGVVAVDPRVVPLGSLVRIAGLGTYRALDTGGAIVGNRLDVWVPDVPDAYRLTGAYAACWRRP